MAKRLIVAGLVLIALFVGYRLWYISHLLNRAETVVFGTSIGPDNAKDIIVEFLDYRCSHCRKISPMIMEFAKNHPDVKIIFRHYPIFEEPSVKEADIALAAAKQGKFLPVHEYLIARENPVEDAEIPGIVKQFGLDQAKFDADMHAADTGALLLETLDMADAFHMDRAPSFLFNRTVFVPEGGMPDLAGFEKLYEQHRKR